MRRLKIGLVSPYDWSISGGVNSHVKDLAEAVYFCLRKQISQSYLNVGSNHHISIQQVAKVIQNTIQYKGKIFFNKKFFFIMEICCCQIWKNWRMPLKTFYL